MKAKVMRIHKLKRREEGRDMVCENLCGFLSEEVSAQSETAFSGDDLYYRIKLQ